MAEEDVPKTAFICHWGTFEFTRMPFEVAGEVAGGPATFQTLMDKVLEYIKHGFAMAFLGDMLVYPSTLGEHVVHVQEVLDCLKTAGLTLNPGKVQVRCQTLKFLEHIIFLGQCRLDKDKVLAVLDYPRLSTAKQLQAFLGLVGY